ncbi:MAG: hypothetical protein AB8B59_08570 [Maribacter sp.]
MRIRYTRALSESELNQILVLQRKNATKAMSSEEKQSEGFVTILHNLGVLKKMNDACPHIIA